MSNLGISIVIPCYKTGQLLLQAVYSIKTQNIINDYEIIIVDDSSPDIETKQALDALKNEPNILLLKTAKNSGAQGARNIGIANTKYDYILMMDSDDMLNADKNIVKKATYIDEAIDVLHKSEDTAFVHSATIMFGKKNELRNCFALSENLIMQKNRVSIGLLFRKSDLACKKPYAESILKWQDWSFAVGLLNQRILCGKKNEVVYLKQPHYLYRIHDLTKRISKKYICEKEMIERTLNLYPEIFEIHFPDKSSDEIINFLLISSQNIRKFKPHACFNCDNLSASYCVRKTTTNK